MADDPPRDYPLTAQGVPEGYTLRGYGTCRSCSAAILWARNDTTKRMAPLNPDGTSHFATCPQAARWRKSG